MKKYLFLIYLVPFLFAVVAVGYFGYHRPNQQENEAPSVAVDDPTSSITTGKSLLKQPPMHDVVNASDKDSNTKKADRQVETNTPGTTDVAVGSSPDDSRTITTCGLSEGEHSHSLEEIALEKAEYEALMKEQIYYRKRVQQH